MIECGVEPRYETPGYYVAWDEGVWFKSYNNSLWDKWIKYDEVQLSRNSTISGEVLTRALDNLRAAGYVLIYHDRDHDDD